MNNTETIIEIVKKALSSLLEEQLFTSFEDLSSKEKYMKWQLSQIFSFPIDIIINVSGKSGELTAIFKYDGEEHEIRSYIN